MDVLDFFSEFRRMCKASSDCTKCQYHGDMCKVGDTVYRLQYVEESPGRFIVDAVPIKFALIWFDEFGKTVFLTREEAKKELEVIKHE